MKQLLGIMAAIVIYYDLIAASLLMINDTIPFHNSLGALNIMLIICSLPFVYKFIKKMYVNQ